MDHASSAMSYRKANSSLRCIAAAALTVHCTGCVAMERMEQAVVTVVDGVPCFSIPQTSETRNGIPLYGISVGELTSADWKSSPLQSWGMGIEPPGRSMLLTPQNCLRCGEKPANVMVSMGTAKALIPYQIYAVSINARPEIRASPLTPPSSA